MSLWNANTKLCTGLKLQTCGIPDSELGGRSPTTTRFCREKGTHMLRGSGRQEQAPGFMEGLAGLLGLQRGKQKENSPFSADAVHLGDSVGWASDPWLWLRSWSGAVRWCPTSGSVLGWNLLKILSLPLHPTNPLPLSQKKRRNNWIWIHSKCNFIEQFDKNFVIIMFETFKELNEGLI